VALRPGARACGHLWPQLRRWAGLSGRKPRSRSGTPSPCTPRARSAPPNRKRCGSGGCWGPPPPGCSGPVWLCRAPGSGGARSPAAPPCCSGSRACRHAAPNLAPSAAPADRARSGASRACPARGDPSRGDPSLGGAYARGDPARLARAPRGHAARANGLRAPAGPRCSAAGALRWRAAVSPRQVPASSVLGA